jgi:protein-tyrosine phosphatase
MHHRAKSMIDLHCHMLPGVDDGAPDLHTALGMARTAAADGIETIACTPHFMPGVYDNGAEDVRARVTSFNAALAKAGIVIAAVTGADAHVRPDFVQCLREGRILTINDSRYVLVEPPHHIKPPKLEELLFEIVMADYVPILTHPERLGWIEHHYATVRQLARNGVWMQVTGGSLTGRFGRRVQYCAERLLSEGLVHILATDAHNLSSRPPLLAEARAVAERLIGVEEANHLVTTRPRHILMNDPPEIAPALPASAVRGTWRQSFWARIRESIWA